MKPHLSEDLDEEEVVKRQVDNMSKMFQQSSSMFDVPSSIDRMEDEKLSISDSEGGEELEDKPLMRGMN